MKKIPTLFQRDPDNMRLVLPRLTPGCEWVLRGHGRATRKYDGTCTMLDADGRWWARRMVRVGKTPPPEFIPVDAGTITGKTFGWEPIEASGFAKLHAEALARWDWWTPGTYELCGPKIQGNPEGFEHHVLVAHGRDSVELPDCNEDGTTAFALWGMWLADHDYEGVVWWHEDGRQAKLKRSDFDGR